MPSVRRRIVQWGVVVLTLSACSPEPSTPDLATIYSRVASASDGELRRPLITVPGTLGSRLVDQDTGTIVWGGGSRGLSADPTDPLEARLIALPLLDETVPFERQRDGVAAAGVLDTAEADVLGLTVELEVYAGIKRTLNAGGFRVGSALANGFEPVANPGPEDYRRLTETPDTAFRFDYDWRRDIASLAQEFHDFILQRQKLVAAQRSARLDKPVDPASVTFDLLAHSMGGLVTRYYLMHGPAPLGESGALPPVTWEGAKVFNRVIIVAAPNAGSILAMDNLVNGKELGPFQPFYDGPLLATHASTWQLMPRARHNRVRLRGGAEDSLNIYDAGLWERYGWAMASPKADALLATLLPDLEAEERRARALTHQRRMLARAERFHEAMDRWAPKPSWLEMFLVVGGGFQTAAQASVDGQTGTFQIDGVEEGDGVVLRASVLLDERQGRDDPRGLQTPLRFDTTLFLPDEHVELTKNPVFGDNLLFWLLEEPRDSSQLAEARRNVLNRSFEPEPDRDLEALAARAGGDR